GGGVTVSGSGNFIGGAGAGEGNLISGSNFASVVIGGMQNVVKGNLIGTQADGISPLGNNGAGVVCPHNSSGNVIGGTESGAGNVIAYNAGSGIADTSTDSMTPTIRGNTFRGNSIFSNNALGIDVGDDSRVTLNDAGDGDQNRQNFPLITSATTGAGGINLKGTFNSAANATFALDFYANEVCDATGFGEGKVFIGTANLTTDALGNADINVSLPVAVAPGKFITVTATNANSETSEFSQCRAARENVENDPCVYTLSPANKTSPAAGETFTVGVLTQNGCHWTATSNSNFISVTSGANSSGNGLLTLVVSRNESGVPRTGTVTIGGQTFTVTQPEIIPGAPAIQFSERFYQAYENTERVTLTVLRSGDLSNAASVDYRTVDVDTFTTGCANGGQGAFGRCDFSATYGRLAFSPGELHKTITIPLINDGHSEATEPFQVVLSNPVGLILGGTSTAQVHVLDDDPLGTPNPIFNTPFFVRQHYLDFLSREPEPSEPWSAVLDRCPNVNRDPVCDRITVSQSFFGSTEFRLKGSYVFRFYKVAFDRLPHYTEIVADMSFVAGATEAEVYARKAQLATLFTERFEFQTAYTRLSQSAFVAALLGRYGITQITTPDPAQPDGSAKVTLTQSELITKLDTNALTRAQVLRAVADSEQVSQAEFNNTFVAMQYYGYLRRTPEESGYQAWLRVIKQDPNNIRIMVDGFMNSTEYRLRFGQP
ncbi:MAG TPA: Calx-beta domain-containing protein, partial [Pyrinomonadaceae bacterium]